MKKNRLLSFLLAGCVALSLSAGVSADVEDEIAYEQEQKAEAEASLAATQAAISGMESKKQALQEYLSQLQGQYDSLSTELAQLEEQAKQKADELIEVKEQLREAQIQEKRQYEAMKLRIVYLYENGGQSVLETLLAADDFADFLSRAINVSEISKYDRDMLDKYEETCVLVEEKEKQVNREADEISALQEEKAQKQQEVSALVAGTNSEIQSYIARISASEQEASALMALSASAENRIAALYAQAEAEREAAAAAAAAEYEEEYKEEYNEDSSYEESYDEDYDTEDSREESYDESYSESESSYDSGENDYEESYEEPQASETDYAEETSGSSGSGQGTYLGNFKLTGYCNCAQCCGTAGNATASGAWPSSGHTVAMAGVPFGTQLLINGTVYTVEDLGTPYGHVDIYFDSHSQALAFGLQYADVYQLN